MNSKKTSGKLINLVKPYVFSFAVTLLAVLLFELIYYPLDSAQLAEKSNVKTAGSLLLLTDETPQELQVYHRAPLLPRYRLKYADKVEVTDYTTANVDWFQTCVLSIEDYQIVLYDLKYNARWLQLWVCLLWFSVLLYQTWVPFYQRARRRKQTSCERKPI